MTAKKSEVVWHSARRNHRYDLDPWLSSLFVIIDICLIDMPAPQLAFRGNDVSSPHYRAASISLSDEIHSFQSSLIVVSALVRAPG
jgi:hypothetical protein